MNIALGIEYSGSTFCGWQRQSHAPSVQQVVEEVLAKIANHPVKVYCAGRTDTGVHATGQVVNFELSSERSLKAWELGANTMLPDDVSIRWARPVSGSFHARFSAFSRRYRYIIQNTDYQAATLASKVTWVRPELNAQNMHVAAQSLLGEHDFTSFRASSCQAATSFRSIESISVTRINEFIVVDIKANAFLHHMVRNIVGCLIEVGVARQSVDYVERILGKKDRTQAPITAKPYGLYLVEVGYPKEFNIPQFPLGPLTFADQLI